jgi:predicted DNA-binding mobile mystery protein A
LYSVILTLHEKYAMKQIIIRQYQDIIDNAAKHVKGLSMPKEGWIRTMRKALGMSGAQLARRLNVTRSQVSQSEKNELSGVITFNTLENMAEAMGCRIVYTIVPETTVRNLVSRRARKRAVQLVNKTNIHMALESQMLDKDKRAFEVERIQQEFITEMPSDLWNDE